jgi:Nin one binding (NOB1) Zn-ribbon like
MSKEFCPHCGNHTLIRQSVRVSTKGKVSYHGGSKAVFNKRGSKYSIPKPKGGRNNSDIILREDQMFDPYNGRVKPKGPEKFEDAIEFGFSKVGAQKGLKQYGKAGNPNQVKNREGRKRRGRRKK